MAIYAFAKMKLDDQASYVANMVEGAAKILKEQGHPDQAQKALDLFNDASKTGGLAQFVATLKEDASQNTKNAINPNNRKAVLQVEDAMEHTLKENGVLIPAKTLMAINEHFTPAAPNIQAIRDANQ